MSNMFVHKEAIVPTLQVQAVWQLCWNAYSNRWCKGKIYSKYIILELHLNTVIIEIRRLFSRVDIKIT